MDSRWAGCLVSDRERLQWDDDGIVRDLHSAGASQKNDAALRDDFAAPFVSSREAATREATRHHARGVMLRRAEQMVASVPAGGLVVDVGCGFGWHWIDLAASRRDVRFVLIDFSAVSLRVCRNLMPFPDNPNVLCLQASALDLPLQSGVASAVWTVQVLQHLRPVDRRKAMAEMDRILAVAGSFYLAWLRQVPVMKMIYRAAGRRYHVAGDTPYGLYLDRFAPSIHSELQGIFPKGRLSLSESLFHPELRLRFRARWIASLDSLLSSSPLGPLAARQAEFRGQK